MRKHRWENSPSRMTRLQRMPSRQHLTQYCTVHKTKWSTKKVPLTRWGMYRNSSPLALLVFKLFYQNVNLKWVRGSFTSCHHADDYCASHTTYSAYSYTQLVFEIVTWWSTVWFLSFSSLSKSLKVPLPQGSESMGALYAMNGTQCKDTMWPTRLFFFFWKSFLFCCGTDILASCMWCVTEWEIIIGSIRLMK